MSYSAKMITGGKVVIPAELRRELGFKDGDRLVIESDGTGVTIKTHAQVVREVQAEFTAMLKGRKFDMDDFIAERRAEAVREDAEYNDNG